MDLRVVVTPSKVFYAVQRRLPLPTNLTVSKRFLEKGHLNRPGIGRI